MKILSRAIHLMWLIALAVFSFASSVPASGFSSAPGLFAYDGQNQVTMVYDGGFPAVFDYDSAAVFRTGEEANPTSGASSLFGKIASFRAAKSVPKAGPLPPGEAPYQLKLFPDEAYDRVAQYGRAPTAAQRASVPAGMEFDHNPTLVQHYYEGTGGGLPGFNLTQTERLQYSQSLSSGAAATPAAQRAQGAAAAAYSKAMKKLWGLE